MPLGSDRFTAMTAALAITTGLAALLAGVLRLGFVASFISEPVIKGFIVGLALTIIIGQVPKLLGIKKGTGDFFQQLWHVIIHLGDTQGTTLLVGSLSLAVILALRRLAPVVPGSLVAVLLGVVAVKLLHLDEHGVSIVGPIKSGLPTFGTPNVPLKDLGTLVVARPDFIAALAALLGVTVFDTLPGLFIGIGVSLLLLIFRASRPYIATLGREPGPNGRYSDMDRHPDNELPSHIAVLRIESSLYFANADTVRTRIFHAAEADGITAIILDAETIPFIDVTAARMLATLAKDLDRRNIQLLLARDIGQVRDILHSVIDNPAITHFYPTVQAAVAAAQEST